MKDILIDFGIPALVLLCCTVLLLAGRDGEVKVMMAGAVAWMGKAGYARIKAKEKKNDALESKSDGY